MKNETHPLGQRFLLREEGISSFFFCHLDESQSLSESRSNNYNFGVMKFLGLVNLVVIFYGGIASGCIDKGKTMVNLKIDKIKHKLDFSNEYLFIRLIKKF